MRAGNQGMDYLSFLAKCYSTDHQCKGFYNQYMWITWHPFSVTKWKSLCTSEMVVEGIVQLRERLFGEEVDEERARALIDYDLVNDMAGKLWIIVLSEKQEKLVITRENRGLVYGKIGRGVLDERRADLLATGLTNGFIASKNLHLDQTRSSIAAVNNFFSSSHAARIVEFFRAVWVGSGGEELSFPAQGSIGAGLTDDAIAFLLDFEPSKDPTYWRRIGRKVSLESLARLRFEQPSLNFAALVEANMGVLTARACSVHDVQTELTDAPRIGWRVDGKGLIFFTPSYSIRFVASREDLSAVKKREPVDLRELVRRARAWSIPIDSVEMSTRLRKISYGSRMRGADQDVSGDEQLEVMIESFGDEGYVSTATALSMDRRNIVCDFERQVAGGRGPARFSLADLVLTAVPLLLNIDREAESSLSAFTNWVREESYGPSLF
jgi:hypothetical protein